MNFLNSTKNRHLYRCLFFMMLLFQTNYATAQTTLVGSGSYTNQHPGSDAAGRNKFPPGSPQLSKNALGKPVPTNDWWSKLIQDNHAGNLFNYPMTMRTQNEGLIVTYIPWGVIGDSAPIEVGVVGLNASKTTVADYSDWTVTMNWSSGANNFQATSGIGMPFLYFNKNDEAIASVTINSGTVTITDEVLTIENASAGADFVCYAPVGSTWIKSGTTYTSTLNDKNYWSMAMLPQDMDPSNTIITEYQKYAYVFPTDTKVDWAYDANTGQVLTDFEITTEVKEGSHADLLQGLLPHQWDNLTDISPKPEKETYQSVRGALKMLAGNSFQVANTFKGILPTLPYLANYSDTFSPATLQSKIAQIQNDGLATWTDSYNEGQVMNRLIQTARIADQMGNTEGRDKMIATVKERLEDWLSYQSGEKAFLFYYNNNWSTLIGYPAGHGQDDNINDHHFHWGYFIHAAAFMEQYEPGWADKWGPMVNLLVRDAASTDRADAKFPFLRNFSPYAGHCWANGFASFPQGNDQESTSESMQFNSSLIHWGSITGNDEIRDLGIYLYTTEQTAIEEYWLDTKERNFKSNQPYSLVSRVWGNSYDNGTFWTSDITASYGIEMYPMHGGSLYLGQDKAYATKLWNEIESNTGILSPGDDNPNLWHDTFLKYLSFIDAEKAIAIYNANPDRILKFGVSDAQTYHWLHAMNALGAIDATVTADYPIAAVFEKEGEKIYVAHNYTAQPLTVTFSDGETLEVASGKMVTSKDVAVTGTLTSNFDQAYVGGSVNVTLDTESQGVTKVAFYNGNDLLGEVTSSPYIWKVSNLSLGVHGIYARVYEEENFNVSNSVTVTVGEQVPFSGAPIVIPGTFEAGHYDAFQGGVGQGISYLDLSQNNEGGYRPDEYVDSADGTSEGATLGWLAAGEWLEYTIDVQEAGYYSVAYRCASGNSNGGGPFYFEMEGERISAKVNVASTSSTKWDVWTTKTLQNVPLEQGEHVLRLVIDNGEFNLGKMTFTKTADLDYQPPVAAAGTNISVLLSDATAVLDASASSDPEGQALTYGWKQLYGPTEVVFENATAVKPQITDLEAGVYNFELTVSDGVYTSKDQVKVLVSETGNANPSVAVSSPEGGTSFVQGEEITITAIASDFDGDITKVEFYDGGVKIGEDTTYPYQFTWSNAVLGTRTITAKATDDFGATTLSEAISVEVAQLMRCSETSNQASEGSFDTGYKVTFETLGTRVKISFQLLDNKTGVVAYLFRKEPFSEKLMQGTGANTFSETISGFAAGETISYACKFAFTGGMAVTKYFDYKVGDACAFELPSNNFDIEVTDETCEGKENGALLIQAKAVNTYKAVLNGQSYNFSNNQFFIQNLAVGTYDLCVQIPSENYTQCYVFEIMPATTIAVKTASSLSSSTVELSSGTAPYHVLVNGTEVFTTMENSFDVAVSHGDLLEVKTEEACEGVFSKTIDLYSNVKVTPNPTRGIFEIHVPQTNAKMKVEVYTIVGSLLQTTYQSVENARVSMVIDYPAGVYFVKVHLPKPVILKIIKQ